MASRSLEGTREGVQSSGVGGLEGRSRSPVLPTDGLFFLAVLFCVLAAAPGLKHLGSLAGVPLRVPLCLLWVVAVLAFARSRSAGGIALAAGLVGMAAVPTLLVNDPESYRAWLSVLVPGAVLFAGLQVISAREVARARASFRLVLGLAATLQLAFYVQVAGLANLASPTYVATHHTDVLFWENVGSQVLANPTNASVVYCTGFALAVAERAARRHRRFWWVLALVSGLAIFCTGSRGAALTAGLTLLAAALFHSRTRMRAILTVVVSGILFTAVNYWLANISAGARTGESLAARMEARLATLPVIADHPLGQGPGRTAEVLTGQLGHVSFIGDTIDGATSHDLFLNWAVGIGWLGLTLLLAAFAIAVSRTLHAYPGVRMLALIPLAAFLFSAQSTGLDVLNGTNAAWSATMFVLLGLCWRGAVFRRVDTHVTPVSRPRALQPGSLPGRRQ